MQPPSPAGDSARIAAALTVLLLGASCLFADGKRPTPAALAERIDAEIEKAAFATQRGSTIRVWDLAADKELGALTSHRETIEGLALSPNGKLLASGSLDTTVLVWDLAGLRK